MDPNVFETANAGFAQSIYEDFLRDPASVAPAWRQLFESGVVGEQPHSEDGAQANAPAAQPAASAAPAPVTPPDTTAAPAPEAIAIKGPALRLLQNMNESLTVPTATTFRELPVARLEAQRKALNASLKSAGRSDKISFTHLIAWALVQGVRQHPVMGHFLRAGEDGPQRVVPDGIHLGLAVDVTRKDGSRGLVVPIIKHAEAMDFGRFHASYEELVDKSRHNRLMPDDFAGGTVTLTNPGGIGTVASVPRLMAGQGTIIAVGAIGYPPEFSASPVATVQQLGLSKVMTMTSTYDHRIIQGAESGQFLATVDGMLQGAEGFYESVYSGLGLAYTPSAPTIPFSSPALSISPISPISPDVAEMRHVAAAMALVKAFRTHGHLAARLDPLGSEPSGDPSLDPATVGLTPDIMARIPAEVLRIKVPGRSLLEALPQLQAAYCGTIAYEIEHIASHEERVWLRERIESGSFRETLSAEVKLALFDRLIEVEAFEQVLQKSYLGQKRFSIEGLDMMVPMLDLWINQAAERGAQEVPIGMAHRGRLNVLAHTVRRPYETIFAEFEGAKRSLSESDESDSGTGDVKYHHGAEGAYPTAKGKAVTVTLAPNPSHLEFVGPVVVGRARARQTQRRGQEARRDKDAALPIVIHGDAAFAGQGVVAETFNLGGLPAYTVGGTLHLIANNQVGFTTDITDARSTRYASDLAKGFDVPIVHVNADDPEACLVAARLALAYREIFSQDAVVDLVGYRRHGHNEADEPAYTQPLMYERIRQLPTVRQKYAAQLVQEGVISETDAAARYDAAYERLANAQHAFKGQAGSQQVAPEMVERRGNPESRVETAVPAATLVALNDALLTWPEGFAVNRKLARQLERRRTSVGEDGGIDWAHAEELALASLLVEGIPLRMTGQDTERGTFSQRHLVLHDVNTGIEYAPITRLPGALAPMELHNSPLSELAAIGFEYGYSVAAPETMIIWEAQFGDFVNGAQVMIDQFLAAGLAKWGQTTRLTLLLPHGYEGQGPEHSSGRLERFLQLAAENNMRIANCSTPAQYFHLLRRQAKSDRIRPLIVMTPKSLLRLPAAASHIKDLSDAKFQPVIDDARAAGGVDAVARMIVCTGKVYYELLDSAKALGDAAPAIVRLEQLYPFPDQELRAVLGHYAGLKEVVWTQEEPRNMGAWRFAEPHLRRLLPEGVSMRYAGRPDRASPAEGYPSAHVSEQARILAEALGTQAR